MDEDKDTKPQDTRMFCPLKQNGNGGKCDQEKCAWWFSGDHACVMVSIAATLDAMLMQRS